MKVARFAAIRRITPFHLCLGCLALAGLGVFLLLVLTIVRDIAVPAGNPVVEMAGAGDVPDVATATPVLSVQVADDSGAPEPLMLPRRQVWAVPQTTEGVAPPSAGATNTAGPPPSATARPAVQQVAAIPPTAGRPSPAATVAPPPWGKHTVRSGENLSLIAQVAGVKLDSLSTANGLSQPGLIYPGQVLYVPPAGWTPPWLKQDDLKKAQQAGWGVTQPWIHYTVRGGDALSVIAQTYKVDLTTLLSANGLTQPNLIYSGQTLHVPPATWRLGQPIPPDPPAGWAAAALPMPVVAPPALRTYQVRPGDTLSTIAQQAGIGMDALAAANGVSRQGWVYSGQTLHIPGAGAVGGGKNTLPAFITTGWGTESLAAPPSLGPQAIDRILSSYGSPAVGTGSVFYSMGVQYGIDPAYALAFFIHESTGGTRGVARSTRAIGNIRWTPGYSNIEGFRAYARWEDSIVDWYQLISGQYMRDWGLTTVRAVIPRYAPAQDNNDEGAYVADVENLVHSWGGGFGDALGGSGLRANLLPRAFNVTTVFGHYADGSPHYGLDLDASFGTAQTAPVGGVVVETLTGCVPGNTTCGSGWGNHVWWRSSATGHYILAAHFSDLNPALKPGAVLGAGTVLGLTGNTGYATGPHVHLQVNPAGPTNAGSFDPSYEFPWLACGSTGPGLGAPWGNAACR